MIVCLYAKNDNHYVEMSDGPYFQDIWFSKIKLKCRFDWDRASSFPKGNTPDWRGGEVVRKKFAEHMPKICSGLYLAPTHQIFSINQFFRSIFRTH